MKSSVAFLLYNVIGRLVKTLYKGEVQVGFRKINIPIAELKKGLYFVEMKVGEIRGIKKVVVVK